MLEYLLPVFISSVENYSIEVLNMLCHYDYDLLQDKHKSFFGVALTAHSAPAHNIPADLHQEHLNHICKLSVRGLQANKTEKAII